MQRRKIIIFSLMIMDTVNTLVTFVRYTWIIRYCVGTKYQRQLNNKNKKSFRIQKLTMGVLT